MAESKETKFEAIYIQDIKIENEEKEFENLAFEDEIKKEEMDFEEGAFWPEKKAPEEVSVSKIKRLKFSQLSLEEKIKIKADGRPTPIIQIAQPGMSNNKKYIRSFNPEWYAKKSWLCGCDVNNALFCFPCLLLGDDLTWSITGFTNINKMKEKTEKHEYSRKHIDNVISLSLLGSFNIKESEAYRLSIIEHNSKVAKNREILSKIIDCIKFCGDFEFPLRGHDESEDSLKPCVFKGLLNFASRFDADLRYHLESNAAFKDVSRTMQNDILDCLLQICQDEIRKEIRETSFVAVMSDDTTDVSETTQMVIVLRYELNGEIFERFWGFFIPENQTADGLSKSILDQLNIILEENTEKLIAQTFDGANVMIGINDGVQAKIKEIYKNAHFIHCYAHHPDLMIKSAASKTQNSRIFLSNLLSIPSFFSRSPQRLSILNKHVNSRIPRPSSTKCNLNVDLHTVRSVYENFESLKKCMEEIQSTFSSDKTISEATGILHILNTENFVFWLKLFHQIMPHVEEVYNQMQSREIDAIKIHEYIANFKNAILELKNHKYCENPTKTQLSEAKEICDFVCVDINERYSFTKHLLAAKLFCRHQFENFNINMPLEVVTETIEAYPMIEKAKFLTELQVFYSRHDLHNFVNLINLLEFLTDANLKDVLCELTKLIKILLTIPMTTAEPERCFSTLRRIKLFLRSTMHQERLNALAMISMEKSLINRIPNLNEKVINLFAQKKARRIDFTPK